MTLLLAATIPVLVFLYYIFKKDKNREPINLLLKCFFGGFLALIIALIIDFPLMYIGAGINDPFSKSFFEAFFVAGLPEEIAKFIILYWIVWKNKFFDEHYDGIVLAVFVSMGFAFIENILYVFENGMQTAILRAIFSIPGHGLFAISMGYYFSFAKHENKSSIKKYLLLSIITPALLHGTYDFFLMYASNLENCNDATVGLIFILFFVFFIFMWKYGIRKINKHIAKDIQSK
jgi:RsiW-degrading membrane proteinase PrsW (M82 family)